MKSAKRELLIVQFIREGLSARTMKIARLFVALATTTVIASPHPTHAQTVKSAIHLDDDQPVTLRFYGSRDADLFTQASFDGVLKENYYSKARDGFPAGFINASAPGGGWAGTMWSRDGSTFTSELIMRGYYQHASLLAECLMALVRKNAEGFYTFPVISKDRSQATVYRG